MYNIKEIVEINKNIINNEFSLNTYKRIVGNIFKPYELHFKLIYNKEIYSFNFYNFHKYIIGKFPIWADIYLPSLNISRKLAEIGYDKLKNKLYIKKLPLMNVNSPKVEGEIYLKKTINKIKIEEIKNLFQRNIIYYLDNEDYIIEITAQNKKEFYLKNKKNFFVFEDIESKLYFIGLYNEGNYNILIKYNNGNITFDSSQTSSNDNKEALFSIFKDKNKPNFFIKLKKDNKERTIESGTLLEID